MLENMRGKVSIIFLVVFIIAVSAFAGSSNAMATVTYKELSVNNIDLSIIEIKDEKIVPLFATGTDYSRKIYTDETFESIVARASATAAINGCFFDTLTDRPIGDIAADGKKLIGGGGWAYFGVKEDGTTEFGKGSRKDWKGYTFGLTCLPLLIKDGKQLIGNTADMRAAGFKDPVVYMNVTRAALATAPGGKILFVTSSPAYMYDFASALLAAGADNALGLDGGAATGLYFNGKTIINPVMNLTHVFAILDNQSKDETAK